MSEGGAAEAEGRWRAIAESDDFTTLMRERRRLTSVLMAVSLGWFAIFLLLATFAKDFMGGAVFAEELTVAYVLGLSQFVLTFVVIRIYAKRADGRFAELEQRVAASVEGGGGADDQPERTPFAGGPR